VKFFSKARLKGGGGGGTTTCWEDARERGGRSVVNVQRRGKGKVTQKRKAGGRAWESKNQTQKTVPSCQIREVTNNKKKKGGGWKPWMTCTHSRSVTGSTGRCGARTSATV